MVSHPRGDSFSTGFREVPRNLGLPDGVAIGLRDVHAVANARPCSAGVRLVAAPVYGTKEATARPNIIARRLHPAIEVDRRQLRGGKGRG